MSKTKEELITLKQEYETLNTKLKELSEDELNYITGGNYGIGFVPQIELGVQGLVHVCEYNAIYTNEHKESID